MDIFLRLCAVLEFKLTHDLQDTLKGIEADPLLSDQLSPYFKTLGYFVLYYILHATFSNDHSPSVLWFPLLLGTSQQ